MRSPLGLLSPLLLLSTPALFAVTLVVDDVRGDDAHSGSHSAPLATLARAVELAKPGDRIEVVPGDRPLREAFVIKNRSGEPGRPIEFDGGGREIFGMGPIRPEQWKQVRPGIYRSTELLAKEREEAPRSSSIVARCSIAFDGKLQRMGFKNKLARAKLPSPDALLPGEWTYSKEEGAFYIAIQPGQSLKEAKIEVPTLFNGVSTAGTVRHWRIRNISVHRALNDGFNFHGTSSDVVLENIAAYECGDDGMSAHGKCHITVRGFTSQQNATGICHVDAASSENHEVRLEENIGPNLYLLGSGSHSFHKSQIGTLGNGVWIGNATETPSVTVLFSDTVFMDRDAQESLMVVRPGNKVKGLPKTKRLPRPQSR